MGPLVPDIIGNELNYIVALFIGVAFGFVLEQAGFSTSRKLVGLFYGYDFTVLRVFFTAGVTAMVGVIAFAHFGILDLSLVYVNPTFLWSAIVGGLIMGLGFVVGGYCPGTSVCAAAIGKIDAMIFVGGSFIGVLVFAEAYPLLEGLYKAASWGNVTIFSVLGMSQSLFAFLLVLVAVGAFWAVTMIETRVNGGLDPEFRPVRRYAALTAVAVVVGVLLFALPDRREAILADANDAARVGALQVKLMTPDELAFRIIDNEENVQIVDVRDQASYEQLALPRSVRMTLPNLFDKDADKLLSIRHRKKVFVADEEYAARQAALVADELGYRDLYVLQGGMNAFRSDILNWTSPPAASSRWEQDTFRFRTRASQVIPKLIADYRAKNAPAAKKESKRVVGGC